MWVFINSREGVFKGYKIVRKIRMRVSKYSSSLGLGIILVVANLGLKWRDFLALVLMRAKKDKG